LWSILFTVFLVGCDVDFDTKSNPMCGDGIKEGTENCDGTDFGGLHCVDVTSYEHGELACTPDCRLDLSGCHTCGNGAIEGVEECDDENLGGVTCESLGGVSGTLACSPNCGFDLSGCVGLCGNGTIEEDEECDSTDLGGQTCAGLGYAQGTLACAADCTFDVSQCEATETCGNGTIDPGEECDTTNLDGQTCTALGFGQGTLSCTTECTFDVSQCEPAENCGNGTLDPGEECDDGNTVNTDACLNNCANATCGDTIVWGGEEECDDGGESPTCNADCTIASCGDGKINGSAGEECDDGAVTADCDGDCTAVWCNDGALNTVAGEVCDGTNLNGRTCEDEGYYGGTLACGTNCTDFDTTNCDAVPPVLITEVTLGDPDTVEIRNYANQSIDLQDWIVHWYSLDGDISREGQITLPSYILAPGERTYLADEYEGDNDPPQVIGQHIQAHVDVFWGDYTGAVVLIHPNNQPVDFVRWDGDTFSPPTGTSWADTPEPLPSFDWDRWSLSRLPEDSDTDTAADFCVASPSLGESNQPCTQFPAKGEILINEIDTGTPDRIELYNPSTMTIQLGDIALHWFADNSSNYEGLGLLPQCALAPGEYIVIMDDGPAGDPPYFDGSNIHIPNVGWFDWNGGACALETVLGGLDFVRWGGNADEPLAPDVWSDTPAALGDIPNDNLGRDPTVTGDNDVAGDWCLQSSSMGGANNICN
jgi:cysteine-rich repeat protein